MRCAIRAAAACLRPRLQASALRPITARYHFSSYEAGVLSHCSNTGPMMTLSSCFRHMSFSSGASRLSMLGSDDSFKTRAGKTLLSGRPNARAPSNSTWSVITEPFLCVRVCVQWGVRSLEQQWCLGRVSVSPSQRCRCLPMPTTCPSRTRSFLSSCPCSSKSVRGLHSLFLGVPCWHRLAECVVWDMMQHVAVA